MEFPILSAILIAPVLGVILIALTPREDYDLIRIIAAVMTFITLALSLYVFIAYDRGQGGLQFVEKIPWVKEFGINYYVGVDGISIPMVLLTAIVIFTGVFASWRKEKRVKEFFICLLLLVTGVFGVFIAQDLFIFYIFFELAVIPMYLLIGIWGSTRKEYAAMKLTLYLLFGSVILVIGIIATYLKAGAGTYSIPALASINYAPGFQKFGFLLMLIGFGFLVPIWPLYKWSPDGHVAAPTAVSMLHAGVLMKLGAYGLIRIGMSFFPLGVAHWSTLITILCLVNVAYGAMVAMAQTDLKFVIGFSSVSHMGYVLLGIASLNVVSVNGAITQMFAHGVMTALFFALVGWIYNQAHTRKISIFGGLAKKMPRIAIGFMIAGLASLGLPGLSGFVAEFQVFVGAFKYNKPAAIIAIFGVVITAVYVLRVIRKVFFGEFNKRWQDLEDVKGIDFVPIAVLVGVIVFVGLVPSPLVNLINNGVVPLMAEVSGSIGGGF